MCMGCWEKYGSPKIVNRKTLTAKILIGDVYYHHLAGGGLHVLLDDWNLDCLTRYSCEDDVQEPERVRAEERCLKSFIEMTEAERASALAMYRGYFRPEDGNVMVLSI